MDPAQQQQQQYGQHGAGGEGGQLQQTLTPASVVPPPDPERRKIIEKLAEYSVKNGPDFEALIRAKQAGNPQYAFLFGGDEPDAVYYRWFLDHTRAQQAPQPQGAAQGGGALWANSQQLPQQQQQQLPQAVYQQQPPPTHPHPQQQPPQPLHPLQHHQQQQQQLPQAAYQQQPPPPAVLDEAMHRELVGILDTLDASQMASITAASEWFTTRADMGHAGALAAATAQRAREWQAGGAAAFPRLLNFIYFANDVLCVCKRRRAEGVEWWKDPTCVALRRHLGCIVCCAHMVSGGQQGQERIGQMMVFWTERGMFDPETQTFLSRQCGAHDMLSLLPEPPQLAGPGPAHYQQQHQYPGQQHAAWQQLQPQQPPQWQQQPQLQQQWPGAQHGAPPPGVVFRSHPPQPGMFPGGDGSGSGGGSIMGQYTPAPPPLSSYGQPSPHPGAVNVNKGWYVPGQILPGQEIFTAPALTSLQKIEIKLKLIPQRMVDPEFPAGLLPDLVRAANSRGASLVMGAYAPLDPNDVSAAAAAAAASANPPDNYLAGRLERFGQDVLDGGRSRLKQRDREQARAHGSIKERRLEDMERFREGGSGAAGNVEDGMKVWHGPSGKKQDNGSGGFAGGGENVYKGLGVGRADEELEAKDAFSAFRKKRSGNYHAMIGGGRSINR